MLSADSLVEVTVKETLLGMETDRRVDSLTTLAEALDEQEELRAEQEEALEAADLARAEAEAKLADLETTLSEQASFVAEVEAALAEQEDLPEPTDPEEAAARRQRLQEITAAMEAAKTARDIREAAQRAEEERQRKLEAGVLFCPVDGGGLNFIDSWGFARSGGRRHQGVDMMAAYGTPTVAPVSGQVAPRQQPGRPVVVRLRRQRQHVLRHAPVGVRQPGRGLGRGRHGHRLRGLVRQRLGVSPAPPLRDPSRWRRGGQPVPGHQPGLPPVGARPAGPYRGRHDGCPQPHHPRPATPKSRPPSCPRSWPAAPERLYHFVMVETANGVSLDFAHRARRRRRRHPALRALVSEDEFDAIFGRILERGLDHWADPGRHQPGRINHNDGAGASTSPTPAATCSRSSPAPTAAADRSRRRRSGGGSPGRGARSRDGAGAAPGAEGVRCGGEHRRGHPSPE